MQIHSDFSILRKDAKMQDTAFMTEAIQLWIPAFPAKSKWNAMITNQKTPVKGTIAGLETANGKTLILSLAQEHAQAQMNITANGAAEKEHLR